MDYQLPQLLENSENSTTIIRRADLVAAANSTEEANKWIQLSTDLRYILVNICSGSAATICWQHQTHNGFEIYRQLCNRFSIPVGTTSIGYLTKLLKPTFDMNNFEETFSQWEFELNKFERDNGQALPESVKIAVLSSPQWNKRTTTTTLAAASRTITNIQHHEDNNYGVLHSNNNIQQVETTNIFECKYKSQWKNSTHGHLSNQRKRKRIQRKGQVQR